MTDFKNVLVWEKSRELTKDIYELTKKFPKDEINGLTSKIRNTSIEIGSAIAKGAGRKLKKDFIEQIGIALSLTYELQSHLILALDLGYLWNSDIEILTTKIEEIQKLLDKK
ncbi:four helix bundle protein [Bacteroidota bacterium]